MSNTKVANKQNIKDAIYENNLRLKRWLRNLFPNKSTLDKIGEQDSSLTYNGQKIKGEGGIYFAQCNDPASQEVKLITANDFEQEEGSVIIISFINGNTFEEPKININNKGIKKILYKDSNTIGSKIEKSGLYLFRYANNAYNVVGYLNSDIAIFNGNNNGLVPTASELLNKNNFFLQADGTWQKIDIDFDVDTVIQKVWERITEIPEGYSLFIDNDNLTFVDADGVEFLVLDSDT